MAICCQIGDGDFLTKILMNMVKRRVDLLINWKFFPGLMVVLNDAHYSEDLIGRGQNGVFAGEEPRGDALAVEEEFPDFRGRLPAIHDCEVVAAVFLGKSPRQQVEIGVTDKRLLRFKTVEGDQVLVGGQKCTVPILGEEGKPWDAIE